MKYRHTKRERMQAVHSATSHQESPTTKPEDLPWVSPVNVELVTSVLLDNMKGVDKDEGNAPFITYLASMKLPPLRFCTFPAVLRPLTTTEASPFVAPDKGGTALVADIMSHFISCFGCYDMAFDDIMRMLQLYDGQLIGFPAVDKLLTSGANMITALRMCADVFEKQYLYGKQCAESAMLAQTDQNSDFPIKFTEEEAVQHWVNVAELQMIKMQTLIAFAQTLYAWEQYQDPDCDVSTTYFNETYTTLAGEMGPKGGGIEAVRQRLTSSCHVLGKFMQNTGVPSDIDGFNEFMVSIGTPEHMRLSPEVHLLPDAIMMADEDKLAHYRDRKTMFDYALNWTAEHQGDATEDKGNQEGDQEDSDADTGGVDIDEAELTNLLKALRTFTCDGPNNGVFKHAGTNQDTEDDSLQNHHVSLAGTLDEIPKRPHRMSFNTVLQEMTKKAQA